MAIDYLTTIQYSLLRSESTLQDITVRAWKSPLGAFLKDGNKVTTLRGEGRALTRYFNTLLYPAGGGLTYVAGGTSAAYPTAQAESEVQASIPMYLYADAIGYDAYSLKAMESGSRDVVLQGLQGKLAAIVNHIQDKKEMFLMGRGDGVVGVTNALGSSATEITSETPLLCCIGDMIYSNPDRSIATAGGESGMIEGTRVLNVEPVNYKITIAADTWHEHDVIHWYGAASNASGSGTYPQGIQAMVDSSSSAWCATDSGTYDHVDVYLGITRTTNTQYWAQAYSHASTPDLTMWSNALNLGIAQGGDPQNYVALLNPTTWNAFADTLLGFAPEYIDIKLPGGTYTAPVITGLGQAKIPAIVTNTMPTDKIVLLDTSRFYQLTAPGGWNKQTGSMWERGGTYTATYTAYYDMWIQFALNAPNTSVLIYGVTTT